MYSRPLKLLALLVPLALYLLPFVGIAPNRIVKAQGFYLASGLPNTSAGAISLCAIGLIILAWKKHSLLQNTCSYLLAIALAFCSCIIAGQIAQKVGIEQPAATVSFSFGFWVIILISWLMVTTCTRLLSQLYWQRVLLNSLYFLPLGFIANQGMLEHISLFREFEVNQQAVYRAASEHLNILIITLLLTLPIGFAIGVVGFYNKFIGKISLNLLNAIQTIPSIALFAILLPVLSLLSKQISSIAAMGISGIGTAPAVIALTAYLLLPMVRATISGMAMAPNETIVAAFAMGMSNWQVFWHVRLPLAIPLIISGMRIATVQSVGLAMLAALIGAGGFGTLMFLGLSTSAIDLIILGVAPVIVLAVIVDTLFKLITERFATA